jgi:hypothetical protein
MQRDIAKVSQDDPFDEQRPRKPKNDKYPNDAQPCAGPQRRHIIDASR